MINQSFQILHGKVACPKAACVAIPENASIASLPFFNSFTCNFFKSFLPKPKGSKEKSPKNSTYINNNDKYVIIYYIYI